MLGARDPDFLAADDIAIALPGSCRLQLCRIRSGCGLADAKSLQPELAARDLRQVGALLLLGTVTQERPHRVHLRVACAGVAAAAIDFLEDDGRFRNAQARSAVFLGNQRSKIAGIGQGLDELCRVLASRVELAPVAIRKRLAEIADTAAQIPMEFDGGHSRRSYPEPPAPPQANKPTLFGNRRQHARGRLASKL